MSIKYKGGDPQLSDGPVFSKTTTVLSDLNASATATGAIPAGAVVTGVIVTTTVAITGAANFGVGDGTDADKWGAALTNVAVGAKSSSADFTAGDPTHYAAATDVVLTGNAGFTTGGALVEVFYYTVG